MSIPTVTNGLDMPYRFDTSTYNAIHKMLHKKAQVAREAYQQYGYAWNAVSYRYIDCVESGQLFSDYIKVINSSEPEKHRYIQERELFHFFTAGLSVIDSFSYALFFIGVMIRPTDITYNPNKLHEIKIYKTAKVYKSVFPSERISNAINDLVDSQIASQNYQQFMQWKEIRNILIHRASPGRIIRPTTTGVIYPDLWKLNNLVLDEHFTITWLDWLTDTVNKLLEYTNQFLVAHM